MRWFVWTARLWPRTPAEAVNIAAPPLGAPRGLSASQDASGFTIRWQPPASFGSAGAAAMPYGYRFRIAGRGQQIGQRPWSGIRRQAGLTRTESWVTSTDRDEVVQFQVRAYDADGNFGDWASLTFAEMQAGGRAYSSGYSNAYA